MVKLLIQLQWPLIVHCWKISRMSAGIFTLAISIHICHLWMAGWGEDLLSPYPRSDAYIYIYQAWFTAFVDSDGGFAGEFMSPSLYVWLQTIAYAWFGFSIFVPLFVNSTLVSFAAVFSALTTKRLFSEPVGWIAGIMLALTGPVVFFAGITVKTNLVLFLLALACYFTIRFFQETRFWWAFSAVLSLGLAAMERQNLLILMVLLIVLISLHSWKESSKKDLASISLASLAAVGVLFIVSAWSPTEAEPKLFSPVGLNFYVGNSPNSWGGYTIVEGIHDDIVGHRTEPQKLAEKELGRPLSRWGVSQYWFNKSIDYYVDRPLDYLTLQFRKVGLLFAQYSQGLPEQYHVWRWERPALFIAFIDTGLIMTLSGFGFYYLRSKVSEPGINFLMSGSILYMISVWIFFVAERYRLTLIVLLIPIAAYGVWSIVQQRSIKKIMLSIFIVCCLYGGSWTLNNLIPYGPGWANDHDRFIEREKEKQKSEKRVYSLMQEVTHMPKLVTWMELSEIFERRGMIPDAKNFARKAIAHSPDRTAGYERMLDLLRRFNTKQDLMKFSLLLENVSGRSSRDKRVFNKLKRETSRMINEYPFDENKAMRNNKK